MTCGFPASFFFFFLMWVSSFPNMILEIILIHERRCLAATHRGSWASLGRRVLFEWCRKRWRASRCVLERWHTYRTLPQGNWVLFPGNVWEPFQVRWGGGGERGRSGFVRLQTLGMQCASYFPVFSCGCIINRRLVGTETPHESLVCMFFCFYFSVLLGVCVCLF